MATVGAVGKCTVESVVAKDAYQRHVTDIWNEKKLESTKCAIYSKVHFSCMINAFEHLKRMPTPSKLSKREAAVRAELRATALARMARQSGRPTKVSTLMLPWPARRP